MFEALDHVRFRRGVGQVRQQEPAEPPVIALVWLNDVEEHTHRGGFPSSVWPNDPEHLSRLDGEADILDHVVVAEPLPDAP